MIFFAPAKINLGLHVLRKRNDAYHDIESIFYPVKWYDAVELIPSKQNHFLVYGRHIDGNEKDNLCVKAFRLMQQKYNLANASINLLKNIPSGAGLGGASSDAVAILHLCNQVFDLNLNHNILLHLAAQLGSDCPFFIDPKPAIISGRGDCIKSIHLPLNAKYLLIVWPNFTLSTPNAYAHIQANDQRKPIRQILQQPFNQWQNLLHNDFEKAAISICPEISNIKNIMLREKAVFASMSGSGSSVFGLWNEAPDIDSMIAEMKVKKQNTHYSELS